MPLQIVKMPVSFPILYTAAVANCQKAGQHPILYMAMGPGQGEKQGKE